MKRISPLMQMTMALVALAGTLVLLASLFFDAVPDREAHERRLRKAITEALSVQVAGMLQRDAPREIEKALGDVAARTEGLRSIGVRRADGLLVIDSGVHAKQWPVGDGDRSSASRITVPLQAEQGRWGQVEFAFTPDARHPVLVFFTQPLVQMMLFVSAAGWIVFGLYMRRALQHLDPSTVVPERVQGAFDAMAEGIVVLDTRGQLMMSNKAFRALHPAHEVTLGQRLAALPWMAAALPEDPAQHPWARAMSERSANAGTTLSTGEGKGQRLLIVNAAPITDAGGAVRGCMVTLSDTTELHRAHESLTHAMEALETSKREVEAKNAELERLATRDPLTGTLNRRAFHLAYETLATQARLTAQPVACLMIDIDHFKGINDAHGHGIGDRVIQEVARRLHDSARGTDLLCRWGGEEFCLVAAGMTRIEAIEFAERVRMRLERECGAAVREVPGLRVTASVGLGVLARPDEPVATLIERADQALYRAKRAGRNRVAADESASLRERGPEGRLIAADAKLDPKLDTRPDPGLALRLGAQHVDAASGTLTPEGWTLVRPLLIERARAEGRALGCIAMSIDPERVAPPGASRSLVDVEALARWGRESAPADAQLVRLGAHALALVASGLGIEGVQGLASHLLERVRAQGANVSIGIDALPPDSPGAATLVERAAQAMGRVRREGGNAIALFALSRPSAPSPSSSSKRNVAVRIGSDPAAQDASTLRRTGES
jgi:diguanylate cyclase (GGDEF)-like protein